MDPFDAALAQLSAYLVTTEIYAQRATITRPGTAPDGAGGTTDVLSTVASNVPCEVGATGFTREERELGAQVTASKLWSISVPLSAVGAWTILPGDAITVGGRRYEVQNTNAGEGHAVDLVATCVRLDPQGAAPAPEPTTGPILDLGDDDGVALGIALDVL